MARVTGIGGVFLRARDPEALGRWYREHLGIPFAEGSAMLHARDDDPDATAVWATFEFDTEYFGSASQQVMINYRVDDLDALLESLRASGVAESRRQDEPYGKFAWITDPEGNRIELWEPLAVAAAENAAPA